MRKGRGLEQVNGQWEETGAGSSYLEARAVLSRPCAGVADGGDVFLGCPVLSCPATLTQGLQNTFSTVLAFRTANADPAQPLLACAEDTPGTVTNVNV